MFYNGLVFVFVTFCVAVIKKEREVTVAEKELMDSPAQIYKQIAMCFQVPALRTLVLVLFVWKLPFATNDVLSGLQVQKAGVSKENLAYLGLLVTPVQIFIPLLLGKKTAGKFPLNVIITTYDGRRRISRRKECPRRAQPLVLYRSTPCDYCERRFIQCLVLLSDGLFCAYQRQDNRRDVYDSSQHLCESGKCVDVLRRAEMRGFCHR